jgi:hypothetical protein
VGNLKTCEPDNLKYFIGVGKALYFSTKFSAEHSR